MTDDEFTEIDSSSKQKQKRLRQKQRQAVRKQFDENVWPQMCKERASACESKYREAQPRGKDEPFAYEERVRRAVEAHMRKFAATRDEIFETYALSASSEEKTEATLTKVTLEKIASGKCVDVVSPECSEAPKTSVSSSFKSSKDPKLPLPSTNAFSVLDEGDEE